MKKTFTILIIIISALVTYKSIFNRSPKTGEHRNVKEAYFYCKDCNALYGGRLTKGPVESFRKNFSYVHIHKWKQINKKEFKKLGTEHYGEIWEHRPDSFFNGKWERYEEKRATNSKNN